MLSKVLVDDVFMYYIKKMLSSSGGFAPDPHLGSVPGPRWGFRPSDPLIAHP